MDPLRPNIPFTPDAKALLRELVKDAGVGADCKTPVTVDDFLPYQSGPGTSWASISLDPTETVYVPVDNPLSQPVGADAVEAARDQGSIYVQEYTGASVDQYYKLGAPPPGWIGLGGGGPAPE
jgi:hypothetical protein